MEVRVPRTEREGKHQSKALSKLQFWSCLLLSHLPKQGTWPNPESMWEEPSESYGYRKAWTNSWPLLRYSCMPFLTFPSTWWRLSCVTLLASLAPSLTHCQERSSDFFFLEIWMRIKQTCPASSSLFPIWVGQLLYPKSCLCLLNLGA